MGLIINIDTATDHASVALCNNGNLMAIKESANQKEHAAFLHKAIEDLLKEQDVRIVDVDAFAVTSGPGSYTGLRVGMATAKGLCYALQKPLICINTLQVMACAAQEVISKNNLPVAIDQLLCPMIDARRMEVFMALYTMKLDEVIATKPMILDETFNNDFESSSIYFFGNGSEKLRSLTVGKSCIVSVNSTAKHVGILSEKKLIKNEFSDVVYSEPQYFKEFYNP